MRSSLLARALFSSLLLACGSSSTTVAGDAGPGSDGGQTVALDAGSFPADQVVPADVLFISNEEFALGDGYDPATDALFGPCARGLEVLERQPYQFHREGGNAAPTAEDLDLAPATHLELAPPPELRGFLSRLGKTELAISRFNHDFAQWGTAGLAVFAPVPGSIRRCPDVFIHEVTLGFEAYTALKIEFRSSAAYDAFVAAHGRDLYELLMHDDRHDDVQAALAGVAVARLYHLQVGGDQQRAAALLRNHRCSVGALAECRATLEAIRELDLVRPDPEPGNHRGWVALSGGPARLTEQ